MPQRGKAGLFAHTVIKKSVVSGYQQSTYYSLQRYVLKCHLEGAFCLY